MLQFSKHPKNAEEFGFVLVSMVRLCILDSTNADPDTTKLFHVDVTRTQLSRLRGQSSLSKSRALPTRMLVALQTSGPTR